MFIILGTKNTIEEGIFVLVFVFQRYRNMRFTHISEISDIYGRPPALILGENSMYKEYNLSLTLIFISYLQSTFGKGISDTIYE